MGVAPTAIGTEDGQIGLAIIFFLRQVKTFPLWQRPRVVHFPPSHIFMSPRDQAPSSLAILGKVGIPAPNDVSYFFFSGPRLHLFLASANLVRALVIVFVVSGLSSFYPAWLAMRVSPRQAMQAEES